MQNIIIAVTIIAVAIVILVIGYLKAKPDETIIISGLRRKPKYLIGKAGFKVPFLERSDKLTLRVIKVDVRTQDYVQTKNYIFVKVDAVATIKISSSPELLASAAEKFLNSTEEQIRDMVTDILEGNTREIVSAMNLEEMVTDRVGFMDKVQANAIPDMEKMGIELLTFNVQNFTDKQGVIEDMGTENTTKIKKQAAISRAESERDIEIAKSQAEKEANDVRVAAQTEIAQKNNDLAIKESQLKVISEAEKAKADSAYKIQEQEQRKSVEISQANADLAKTEKAIEIRTKEVEIQEKTLDAEIRKQAEAEKDATKAKSDAELYEEKNRIEAEKAQAIADAEIKKVLAEAEAKAAELEAQAIRVKAEAEAEAIRVKGLAEAEGIRAKAEAMKLMGEAAILEMYFDKLPEIAGNVAKPLESIETITMYGEGNTSKMVEDITKSTTQIMSGLTDALGIDMKAVISGFVGGKMAGTNALETETTEKEVDITFHKEERDN